uniref:Uncharacterized protein n=1 Tax=Arundo donax TaxID=35708 RepID=A0A0A9CVU0_ARUDO
MCPGHQRPHQGSERRAVVTKLMKTSFLCTYSSACLPPRPWADQGSDLAPTCSPCLSPHSLTATPLILFPLSDSSSNGNLAYEVFRLHSYLTLKIQPRILSPASARPILASKKDWSSLQACNQISPLSSSPLPEELLPPLWYSQKQKWKLWSNSEPPRITANSHRDRNHHAVMGHRFL